MSSPLRVIVTGLIAQHPMGGVTWDYLQYPLGLARLGHDVFYFEDSGQWPYKTDGGPSGNDWEVNDCSVNVRYLSHVMRRFGLTDRWAYRCPIEPQWYGLPEARRQEVLDSADLLINVSGTLRLPAEFRQVPRLAYIDSDPVFTQIKLARGQVKFRRRVDAHDVHFSFGERFSRHVPRTPYLWRPTRQPIVLSEWQPLAEHRDVFTTVMNWTSYEPLSYAGARYGQKDREFRRFVDLPGLVAPTEFEMAVSALKHARSPRSILSRLLRKGWRLVDPGEVCPDLDRYRDYIRSSKAEWSVAKNGYVRGQAGWFSCRSACYLAAARPVVVQDTGFTKVLPVGDGILTFRTLEEAAAAVREVERRYEHHAKAARQIAEEYFDSDTVLTRLIDDAMSAKPRRVTEHVLS